MHLSNVRVGFLCGPTPKHVESGGVAGNWDVAGAGVWIIRNPAAVHSLTKAGVSYPSV